MTRQAGWSSSDLGVAVVSETGVVTAVGAGSALISATYQTRTASRTITVDLATDSDWVFLGAIYADGLTDIRVGDIVVDPRDSSLLYVAAERGLFVSRNRGAAWPQHYSVPQGSASGRLALDSIDPDRVFYGVGNTLLVSGDKGATWRSVRAFPEFIRSIEVSRLDTRTIYVGLQGPSNSGIFRSTDGGETWESHAFGYPVMGATQFIPWRIASNLRIPSTARSMCRRNCTITRSHNGRRLLARSTAA